MTFAELTTFVNELEGPYKWYVLTAIIVILTAFITRFVFKTLKWFLLLAAFGILFFAALRLLAQ